MYIIVEFSVFGWKTSNLRLMLMKHKYRPYTLCRSRVWIGMKVLGADSIILGTRKLWWMFPIKQKCHTTAAFLYNPNFSIWSCLEIFLPICNSPGVQISCTTDYHKKCPVLSIFIIQKATVIFNFCLIWKIHHNFLVPI